MTDDLLDLPFIETRSGHDRRTPPAAHTHCWHPAGKGHTGDTVACCQCRATQRPTGAVLLGPSTHPC